MCRPHLLTILYVNQQSINKIPKIWGQQNEKGNGGSPDPFLVEYKMRTGPDRWTRTKFRVVRSSPQIIHFDINCGPVRR